VRSSIQTADIGNEDFNPDYGLNVNDTNSSLLRNYSNVLVSGGLLSPEQGEDFSHCGFYASPLSGALSEVGSKELHTVNPGF